MNAGVKSFLALLAATSVALAQGNIPDLAKLKLAAEAGNAEAQDEYASRIASSNAKDSFEFHLRAAKQGFGPAEDYVGGYYLRVAPVNTKERAKLERLGVRYTSRAAFKGFTNAQERLSDCYGHGTVVPKSPLLSYAWLAIALKTAHEQKSAAAIRFKAELDQLIAKTPSDVIAQGQKIADGFRLGGSGMNSVEADVLVAQMKITGLYVSNDRKAVTVNQTLFAEGETKSLPMDGESVSLLCTAIEGRSAKFRLSGYDFTLTSK